MPADPAGASALPSPARASVPSSPPRPSALSSGAFRFALALALVFAAGSVALLWAVQRQVGGYAVEATDALLRNEAAVLASDYRELGLSGLTDALARHGAADREAQFRYLLVDGRGRRLFGTLPASAARPGWGALAEHEPEGDSQPLKQLGRRLPNGLLLVVATDAFDIASVRHDLLVFTAASGIAITLFALAGGIVAGRVFLGRLERVNSAVGRIIDGDLAERLPEIGVAPEFDTLTRNLNRMLERNDAAMAALRQVSTAIAHDLRTPLTRLRQGLEEARGAGAPDPAALDDAVAQTDAILTTFQALLRIGMLEGGAGRQRFAPVDLGDLLDRLHQLYEPLAEDAGHRFTAEHQPGQVILGDAELLAQMFINAIENAIAHTPAGTRIRSRVWAEGPAVLARIADDGPGVPAADLGRIFRRFYRGEASRGSPGAGLGLSLVAAVADLHGATCTAGSLDPGFVLTFAFSRRADPAGG